MKKDGEWIACMATDLEVSRVDVEASPALDLIEVRTTSRAGGLPRIEFYDREEAAALAEQLHAELDRLEEDWDRARRDATDHTRDPENSRETASHEAGFRHKA